MTQAGEFSLSSQEGPAGLQDRRGLARGRPSMREKTFPDDRAEVEPQQRLTWEARRGWSEFGDEDWHGDGMGLSQRPGP